MIKLTSLSPRGFVAFSEHDLPVTFGALYYRQGKEKERSYPKRRIRQYPFQQYGFWRQRCYRALSEGAREEAVPATWWFYSLSGVVCVDHNFAASTFPREHLCIRATESVEEYIRAWIQH
jgi:hypothetical protein